MFRTVLLALCSVFAATALAADAQPAAAAPPAPAQPAPAGVLIDKVVAVVNDGIVTESELAEQMVMIVERLREQNTPMPDPEVLRKQVLDRLILQEIQVQRADRLGMKVGDEQLNAAMADIAERNNIPLQQLPAALAQQGVDYASYRDNLRKEMLLNGLRQRDVISRISITPRELEQFLDRQSKQPSADKEYNISHILLAVPEDANQTQVDELAARADEVYDRATSGNEDFGRLAVAFSNSQTALEGGSLGWRKGPELPTIFSDLVVALKPGEVSKPLRTPSGFHIVKLNEVRSVTAAGGLEQQWHARHILMTTNELQDDATVRQRLEDIRKRVLNGEDFAVFATTMSEDSGSAVDGGDLGWTGPDQFVPEFQQKLESLDLNQISEPFKSQFGWHIVQLLERREFDTTDELRRQRAFQQLRESKADEETELWLRRIRDEAFVDTDV
ncbi:MAG: peptidylprolyl isomerase [Nevskiaceae bacterium]|jgi:peptidyl-prolyl cis-trans isomerase SurA|nr:peptidylprolyl isomerase [Nevskiaceae bacterium]